MFEMRSAFLGLPGPCLGRTSVSGAVAEAKAAVFLGRPRCLWWGREVGLNSKALLASPRNRSVAQSVSIVKGVKLDCEHSEHTQIPGGTLVNGGVRQYM
jgi:hypothetical protein